jgi:hypothetical protein
MPPLQINGIRRKITTALLTLALAVATRQAAAQPQGELSDHPIPKLTASEAAEKAWAKIGPPIKKVDYDHLPLGEVVLNLQNSFSNQFDVILPDLGDAGSTPISLRLQDVGAGEVFNAMNLVFETEASAGGRKIHWRLILNGSRPTAVLEVSENGSPGPAQQSSVFYIGDLLFDHQNTGFTPDNLFKAIHDVQSDASIDGSFPRLASHADAGLLVVTGTQSQINLTDQTLRAMRQKVEHDRNALLPHPVPFPAPPLASAQSLQHLNQPSANPPPASSSSIPMPPNPPGSANH